MTAFRIFIAAYIIGCGLFGLERSGNAVLAISAAAFGLAVAAGVESYVSWRGRGLSTAASAAVFAVGSTTVVGVTIAALYAYSPTLAVPLTEQMNHIVYSGKSEPLTAPDETKRVRTLRVNPDGSLKE